MRSEQELTIEELAQFQGGISWTRQRQETWSGTQAPQTVTSGQPTPQIVDYQEIDPPWLFDHGWPVLYD